MSKSALKMKRETPVETFSSRFSLRLAPAVAFAALIACCPIQTRANTIALSFTSHNINEIGGGAGDTFGWSFSLSSAVSVTDLGVWDGSYLDFGNGTGDGLAESHLVTIWDSLGVQLAQATVPAGTGATLTNGFRYVTLGSSILLGPGNYVIGMFDPTGADAVATEASGITTAAGVSYTGQRSVAGSAFPSGDSLGFFSSGYLGPNFQFTASASVPDTGMTASLFGLSLTGLALLRRKLC
jgi:hypothetical protein